MLAEEKSLRDFIKLNDPEVAEEAEEAALRWFDEEPKLVGLCMLRFLDALTSA